MSKFFGSMNPNINAQPVAISVYPEKSQYIWIPKAKVPIIIGKEPRPKGLLNIESTNGAILSAKTIFLMNPHPISVKPNFKFLP